MTNSFAQNIMELRYSWTKPDGTKETWEDISNRVVKNVLSPININGKKEIENELIKIISERKFVPGGRFLAQAGRSYHQVNNCFDGNTKFITKNGIFSLQEKENQTVEILNRFGKWEKGVVRHLGKQKIFKVMLSNGDEIFSTENHRWWVDNKIVETKDLKYVQLNTMNHFPDMNEEGIRHGIIYGDGYLNNHNGYCEIIFVNSKKDESLVKYFQQKEKIIIVGFGAKRKYNTITQVKLGTKIHFQPSYYKKLPENINPEYARGFIAGLIATDGHAAKNGSIMIHCEGYEKGKKISEIATLAGCVVSSVKICNQINPYNNKKRELTRINIKPFSAPVILPSHLNNIENKKFRKRFRMKINVESITECEYKDVYCVTETNSESFTLANGIVTGNCFLLRAEDTREGWGDLANKATVMLMSGGGIGVDYSNLRESGALLKRSGGTSSGPLPLMSVINEIGRGVMSGGQRRSAIWAGLRWNHPDIQHFIKIKNWIPEIRKIKEKDFNFPATLDMTNISVILDKDFFDAYYNKNNSMHSWANEVYWNVIERMVKTGEPGFSIDYNNRNESLRNACTEVVSEDDSDVCCLGSINLENINGLEEMKYVTELGTIFLLSGLQYSDVPHPKVKLVREKNSRIAMGIMGIHAWLITHGYNYSENPELSSYLSIWKETSDNSAKEWANKFNIKNPIAKRGIAPNGSISIAGGMTTSGIEPIFSTAYQRRYLTPDGWKKQYVVDFVAERLHEKGIDINKVEDAYTMSLNVEQRIAFQAYVQKYVDNGISSTINLPKFGMTGNESPENFGNILIKYLPQLRGITAYPDSARGGQPLTPVDFNYALHRKGVVFEGNEECEGGVCGL